jgi:hypothetical protein
VDKLSEKEFCMMFKIRPRSKTGLAIFSKEPWETEEELQ